MHVGNLVRIVNGEYQGSKGRISSIHLHIRNNETWCCVQLFDEKDKVFFLDRHLKLINGQEMSHLQSTSIV
jgi:hypothetical protein